MPLLYCSSWSEPESWRRAFHAHDPKLDFRVWPESGPVEEIDYVLAWHHVPGSLNAFPRLKAIFSLGAGVEKLLRDRELPAGVPIVRMVDPSLTAGMTEYVLLHVLRYHRRMPELEALQRRAQWVELEAPPASERRVGIPGLGSFAGEKDLLPMLARSDILVCLLPLTAATEGILNARTLSALPRGACLINAARCGHVVE